MAKEISRRSYPLGPLLAQYRRARGLPPTFTERAPICTDHLLSAPDLALAEALRTLMEEQLPVCFHTDVILRQLPFVRYAISHLFRGQDPLPERLARCVTPGEAYHVPGLGPGFWSHLARCTDPEHVPLWCPAVERGLQMLDLVPSTPRRLAERITRVWRGCASIHEAATDLTMLEISDFLERVSRMTSRELPLCTTDAAGFAWTVGPAEIHRTIREIRIQQPLRKRIRDASPRRVEHLTQFQSLLDAGRYEEALGAFRAAQPDVNWETALPHLDDAYSAALPLADRAVLWCEITSILREQFRVHSIELGDIITQLDRKSRSTESGVFGGFCTDTFAFLNELTESNSRDWMTANRERYRYAVRAPLVELCRSIADGYIRPIVNREYNWDLECDARPGRALTSICKNDYGHGGPYQPVQWVTFYRRTQSNKRADAQFFVRISATGMRLGFHLGRSARDAGSQFRRNIQAHGEAVFHALASAILLGGCRFWTGDDLGAEMIVHSAADLRAWATHKAIAAGLDFAATDSVLRSDDLPGQVLLAFDRFLPLFACAAEADPRPLLARRAGSAADAPPYDPLTFHRDTYLSEVWLDRVLGLLRLKKQLILQGVPGTGKTHVARCLARLLTHDRPECVRLVQFHPAYSYEEFVEGIRVRNVVMDGRNEVSYPVEDGVLCEFAALAASRPSEPHVLIVDEINRGNLPRVFGELLFLLEYRDQAMILPYSKRPFRLPSNLFLIATMNPLDRSAVALDQALRRRFSFVDMPADAAILASWLERNPPSTEGNETFGPHVVHIFEELNARLARDLGSDKQVGHSFFMVPDLNPEKFAAIWEHHVRPMLLDHFGGREERLRQYTPQRLLSGKSRRTNTANATSE